MTRIHHIVNPASIFFTTVTDKIEIVGEFVLIFNKFGSMMAIEPGAPWRELKGKPVTGH